MDRALEFSTAFTLTTSLAGGGLTAITANHPRLGSALLWISPVPMLVYSHRHLPHRGLSLVAAGVLIAAAIASSLPLTPKQTRIRSLLRPLVTLRIKITESREHTRLSRLRSRWVDLIQAWESFYVHADRMNRLAPWKQYSDAPQWTPELEEELNQVINHCLAESRELLRLSLGMLGDDHDESDRQLFVVRLARESCRWTSYFAKARSGLISGDTARERTRAFGRWLTVRAAPMNRIARDTGVERSPRPVAGFTEAPTVADDPRYDGKIEIDFGSRGHAHAFLTRAYEDSGEVVTDFHVLIPYLRIINNDDARVTIDRVWPEVEGFPAASSTCKPIGNGEIDGRTARTVSLDCYISLGTFLPQESGAGRCRLVVKTMGLGTHRRLLSAWMFHATDELMRVEARKGEDEPLWADLLD